MEDELFSVNQIQKSVTKEWMNQVSYILVDNDEKLESLKEEILANKVIGMDTETSGLSFTRHQLVGVCLATQEGLGYYMPVRHNLGKNISLESYKNFMLWIINHKSEIETVWFNAKFDWHFISKDLQRDDFPINHDVQVQIKLHDSSAKYPGLKKGAKDYLNIEMVEFLDNFKSSERKLANFANLDPKDALMYAASDADMTLRLHHKFGPHVSKRIQLQQQIYDLEIKIMPVLGRQERLGVLLDTKKLEADKLRINEQLKILEKDFRVIANMIPTEDVKAIINSPKKLATLLFETLKIPYPSSRKTATGQFSTGKDTIKQLSKKYSICKIIQTWKKLFTLENRTLSALPERLSPDGRMHTNFNSVDADTGRLSSSKFDKFYGKSGEGTNLQQISKPVESQDDEEDFNVRSSFVPAPGHYWVKVDYCLAEGQRVFTDRGLIPIELVTTNDRVVQEDGSFRKVLNVFERGSKPLVKLVLDSGNSLELTEEHYLRVVNKEGDYVWKKLKDFSEFDYVVVNPFNGSSNLDLQVLPSLNKVNSKFKFPSLLDAECAEFFGYLTGDGSVGSHKVSWVVGKLDEDVQVLLKVHSKNLFGVMPDRECFRNGAWDNRYTQARNLNDFLLLSGVSKESVPDVVFRSSNFIKTSWLRGFFEADGCISGGHITGGSSRENLIDEIQMLLLSLGIFSVKRSNYKNGPKNNGELHYVDIPKQYWSIFYSKVGFLSKRKKEKLLNSINKPVRKTCSAWDGYPNLSNKLFSFNLKGTPRKELNNSFGRKSPISVTVASRLRDKNFELYSLLGLKNLLEYGQVYSKVKDVINVGSGRCYDLEVEGTNSFIVEGFVSHNSQIEYRLAAGVSKDKKICEGFARGLDYHTNTACLIFGTTPDKVTKEMRSKAKTFNFGLNYGQKASGLAYNLGCTLQEAERMHAEYWKNARGLKQWTDDSIKMGRQKKLTQTPFGRIRDLHGIDSPDKRLKAFWERSVTNSIIQGGAADILKMKMCDVDEMIYKIKSELGIKLLFNVHDELNFEVPNSTSVDDAYEAIVPTMSFNQNGWPDIYVDFEYGPSWGEVEEYCPKDSEGKKKIIAKATPTLREEKSVVLPIDQTDSNVKVSVSSSKLRLTNCVYLEVPACTKEQSEVIKVLCSKFVGDKQFIIKFKDLCVKTNYKVDGRTEFCDYINKIFGGSIVIFKVFDLKGKEIIPDLNCGVDFS